MGRCALAVVPMLLGGCRALSNGPAETGAGALAVVLPVVDVPRTADPPTLDGELADPAWSRAAVIPGLVPARAAGASGPAVGETTTTVRLLWSTNRLYVAFECADGAIDLDPDAKHDGDLYLHDVCEVFLDAAGDGRQYVEIQVTPVGQTLDMVHLLTAEPRYTPAGRLTPEFAARDLWRFREWELTGLQAATGRIRRDGRVVGWTVEMAVPAEPVLRRLGRTTFAPGELRANFARYDWTADPVTGKRDLHPQYWSPVAFGCPHISAGRMGRLRLQP